VRGVDNKGVMMRWDGGWGGGDGIAEQKMEKKNILRQILHSFLTEVRWECLGIMKGIWGRNIVSPRF